MSSTAGVQNLLVNVFRPVYIYDPITSLFVPKLEVSNIDNYSGNSISVFNAAIGDSNSNVYVGIDAGNVYSSPQQSANNTALGYSAGNRISNVSNSTYIGFSAGFGARDSSNVIGIGANAGGNGVSNIFIGNGTASTGSSNVLIGHGISNGSGTSNAIVGGGIVTTGSGNTLLGTAITSGSNNILIGSGISASGSNNLLRIGSTVFGNLSTKWVGIGTDYHPDPNTRLDVSGNTYIEGQVGINITTGGRTLDMNGDFRATDGASNVLNFQQGLTTSTGGFTSVRGSTPVSDGSNVFIASLKKGLILIAVSSGATNFDGRTTIVTDTTTPTFSNLSSAKSASTTVNFTPDSINISNITGGALTYDWTVTYFPLP